GHGTHVAGIVAAVADNELGGVGVAYNSRIMAIKAAQYNGSLTNSDIAESIYYAVENGADIINMSFGGYAPSGLQRDALGVAFGQAVLVAAAGNDTCVEWKCPMYPAVWPFVIGVMAGNEGGGLASFSNFEGNPRNNLWYEIIAPGTAIYSTLPEDKYAAWNGTSMAAPVVAGVAALVRTKYSDKSIYSSRFISGQVVSTGPEIKPAGYHSLDAKLALSNVPEPNLKVVDFQIFDDPSFSDVNDGDGIIDSGETIELAVTIKNRWGKADPVDVTLSAQVGGAVGPDPYVTWELDKVNYGAVGNFGEDDNGLIRNEEGLVTGVRNPFRFTVSNNTPNNHIIPIKVNIESGNGFDSEDTNAPYNFESNFSLVVQRGRVLPSYIEEDLVMTKDYYWIVEGPVLVPEGVTVTVTEGTQIQFWSKASLGILPPAYIDVEGLFEVQGNAQNPVELFPDENIRSGGRLPNGRLIDPNDYQVYLKRPDRLGRINLDYFKVINPIIRPDSVSNGFITDENAYVTMQAKEFHRTIFFKAGRSGGGEQFDGSNSGNFLTGTADLKTCLINESNLSPFGNISNSCFLMPHKDIYPEPAPSFFQLIQIIIQTGLTTTHF
ncbi:S8 family serine peptidase, partial [Akkermansiaceae bacterium]|nr:S8 family serine peptidase [Akkermansiaceae bacterium]